MQLEDIVEKFPKSWKLKDGSAVEVRPLRPKDEEAFHAFFCAIPETERLLFKHRVTDRDVIHDWCTSIDYGRILPLLAFTGDGQIIADASLHQNLGGWKRHIGSIRIVVHPAHRNKGLARKLVMELTQIARSLGLVKLEAEFMGGQEAARKVFGELGYNELLVLEDYVMDMQALPHDYVLMGRHIITDEEFAGAG